MGKMCLTSVYMQAYVIKYNLIVKMYLNLLTIDIKKEVFSTKFWKF